jgi:hypothetical protein
VEGIFGYGENPPAWVRVVVSLLVLVGYIGIRGAIGAGTSVMSVV